MEVHLSISHSRESSLIKRKGTETHPGALLPKFNTPESVIHSEHREKAWKPLLGMGFTNHLRRKKRSTEQNSEKKLYSWAHISDLLVA